MACNHRRKDDGSSHEVVGMQAWIKHLCARVSSEAQGSVQAGELCRCSCTHAQAGDGFPLEDPPRFHSATPACGSAPSPAGDNLESGLLSSVHH